MSPGRTGKIEDVGCQKDPHGDGGLRWCAQGRLPRVCADVQVGDYTIVHVGFALTKLDEASALETLELFKSVGLLGRGTRHLRWTRGEAPRRDSATRNWPSGCSMTSPPSPPPRTGRDGGVWAARPTRSSRAMASIQLLPDQIELIHGPVCPGVRDPAGDHRPSPGDCRPPGCHLLLIRRRDPGSGIQRRLVPGSRVAGERRIVYSPLDAVKIAQENPDKQVVFFGVGFETTAPANAMTVKLAKQQGIDNFAAGLARTGAAGVRAIMDSPSARVQGFLAAGHVCICHGPVGIYGHWWSKDQVPIVATGFRTADVPRGSAGWFCNSNTRAGLSWTTPARASVQPVRGKPVASRW